MRLKKITNLILIQFLLIGIAEAKTITVGYTFRINDKYDSNAISSMVNGIKAAAIKYENDKKIEIKLKEYAYNSDLASLTKAAEKIIKDNIKIVIGPEMSDEAIIMGDILSPKKITLLSPTASNPNISKGRPYVFSTCFSDKYVSKKLASFAVSQLNLKNIGVLKELDSTYSDFLSTSFSNSIRELNPGIKIIEKTFLSNSMHFDQAINEFKGNAVDVVAVLSYEGSLLEFVKQSSLLNYHPTLIGSDGWGTNSKIHENFVLKSANGKKFLAYRATYWKTDSSSKEALDFKNYLKGITKNQMNEWNAMAFDTAIIAFDAANSLSGSNDGSQIRSFLMKTSFKNLVTTRKLKINIDGTAEKDIHLYKIDKNGVKYEKTL